ncbi:antirestriction protein ArdA [Pseudomonas sp. UBA2684]|uniref:antirestriction protein ArdA n=1 Tax=Pseudomonas sp. UBA2684 TaxID=1947311 RepID=UPI000E9C9F79|nr:antirestriction protein ArdA [Pseudomonas sp. UBA2684]HBX54617.1 antirestriction protein ArdA [Pseudomonas sp.]|tara:strand:- start:42171 stop:42683 length:513 start_codon:yes stop_codon:yes gene_type:complete
MSEHIRIYIADLAAYNAGHLHGVWIDATLDMDDIQVQVDAMLAASPVEGAEEYAIHDFEGFDGYPLGEYEGLQSAHELACFIEEYPEFGGALLTHFNDLEQAQQAAEEDYCGCYTSLADYAQELTEETSSIPQHLAQYIDYHAMARDMEYSGDVLTLETGFEKMHVFWNR